MKKRQNQFTYQFIHRSKEKAREIHWKMIHTIRLDCSETRKAQSSYQNQIKIKIFFNFYIYRQKRGQEKIMQLHTAQHSVHEIKLCMEHC